MFRRMSRERFLSDAELERFLAAVRERHHVHRARDHAFFALLANTGIRPSEALALTRADLHLAARGGAWIHLHRIGKRHTPVPTNELPLHPRVAAVLRDYCTTLPAGAPPFPFCKRQAARLFHYYSRKADIEGHFRVYCLRHTVGMRLWRHTRDLRIVQAVMGHSRLKATMSYVHVPPEQLRQACEAAAAGG